MISGQVYEMGMSLSLSCSSSMMTYASIISLISLRIGK